MLIRDIDHVQIAAPPASEEVARRFFGDLLELEEIPKPEPLRKRGGCWFRIGVRQLHIGVEEPFRPSLKAHPAFLVDDVDGLHDRLCRSDVQCVWDDTLVGPRRFYANDPWGNRIEFTERTT